MIGLADLWSARGSGSLQDALAARWKGIFLLGQLLNGDPAPAPQRLSEVGEQLGVTSVADEKSHINEHWFGAAGVNWWEGDIDGAAAEVESATVLREYLSQSLKPSPGAMPYQEAAPSELQQAFPVKLRIRYGSGADGKGKGFSATIDAGNWFSFNTPLVPLTSPASPTADGNRPTPVPIRLYRIRREGALDSRERNQTPGIAFRAAGQLHVERGFLPQRYRGPTSAFRSDDPPPVSFWYQPLNESGQPLFDATGNALVFTRPDPTELFIETLPPIGDPDVQQPWPRSIRSPLSNSAFVLALPDIDGIAAVRFGSGLYADIVYGDDAQLVTGDRTDAGDGIVTVDLASVSSGDTGPGQPAEQFHNDVQPDLAIIRVLMVAEGYQDVELGQFRDRCDEFAVAIESQQLWPGELANSVAYFRYCVPSDDTGAEIHPPCGSLGTLTDELSTPYDASFQPAYIGQTEDCVLLSGNVDSVHRSIMKDETGVVNIVIVLVNTEIYGGAGSLSAAWVAAENPDARDLVLHELGHHLGVSDEYDGFGPSTSARYDNVTQDHSNLPWSEGATLHTYNNSDPSCDEVPGALSGTAAAENVGGAFRGAFYSSCHWYRPYKTCKMRHISASDGDAVPFCDVCRGLMIERVKELKDRVNF